MKTMANSTRSYALVLAAIVALLVPARARAKDLTLHERISVAGGPSTSGHDSTQYWTASKIVNDDPRIRTITDLGAKTFTMINKDNKTYYTQTFDEMRQHMEGVRAEMKKHIADLPPQAKEMVSKMMSDEGSITLKPTGKTEKIAGYEAKEFTIEDGQISGSVWISDALQPPVSEKQAEEFAKAMGALGGPGAKLSEALAKVKGVALRTTTSINMGSHKMTSSREVTEVSEKAPPADMLEIPAGFKKMAVPAPGAGAGPHGMAPHGTSPHEH